MKMTSVVKVLCRTGWVVFGLACLVVALSAVQAWRVNAAGAQPPGPDRVAIVTQDYTSYEWWLTDWASNKVDCSIVVDHSGLPTGGEIYNVCGQTLYDKWFNTGPCPSDDPCSGDYLVLFKTQAAKRTVGVSLPPPVVWVDLNGCIPYRSTFKCSSLPTLILTGEEPMEGEHITSLAGRIDGVPFTCDAVCQVDLVPTDNDGSLFEFWSNSSYGDSSELFTARVRVIPSPDPNDQSYYTDIVSTQWRGDLLAGCSQVWDAFPTVAGVPDWLSTPATVAGLATNVPYEYLATNLIKHKVVDASGCGDGGLLPNGMVSPCGLVAARSTVTEYQNRYDPMIMAATQKTGIPATVLKSIFSRESQFWPGSLDNRPETGLGQLTTGGADTVLLRNHPFYEQFCPTVMADGSCQKGYAQLTLAQQQLLDDSLVTRVNALCLNCSAGIDTARAEQSVEIFAETLVANCDQVGLLLHNTYGGTAGQSASYEDLWRFTMVNYHSGSGCLTLAIWETNRQGQPLDWAHLSNNFTPVCKGAIDYVNYISNPPH
jgi:hypothetical protein